MTETQTTKDVTVQAYAADDYADDPRDFMDAIDPDTDYHRKETNTTKKAVVEIVDADGEVLFSKSPTFDADNKKLADAVDDLDLGENARVTVETKRDREYINSGYDAARAVMSAMKAHMPETVGSLSTHIATRDGRRYYDDNDNRVIVVRRTFLDGAKVLKHQSKRSADDRYETGEEGGADIRPALQFNVKFGPYAEDAVDEWSSELVSEIEQFLGGYNGIGRIRVADCKKVTEGDCFDI